MNIERFLEERRLREALAPRLRQLCTTCFQPEFGCYCAHLRPFDPKIKFVILIHPIEAKRRIATGRMSHLCLERSRLIVGEDFSGDARVDSLVAEADGGALVLYPGRMSCDLSALSSNERAERFSSSGELTVFVIDGTWATARKMVRSANIGSLPRICFSPPAPSQFRVPKQPGENCYSTIEAIHHLIELLGDARGFDTSTRRHDSLLDVFDVMVERQLHYVRTVRANRQEKGPRRRTK